RRERADLGRRRLLPATLRHLPGRCGWSVRGLRWVCMAGGSGGLEGEPCVFQGVVGTAAEVDAAGVAPEPAKAVVGVQLEEKAPLLYFTLLIRSEVRGFDGVQRAARRGEQAVGAEGALHEGGPSTQLMGRRVLAPKVLRPGGL